MQFVIKVSPNGQPQTFTLGGCGSGRQGSGWARARAKACAPWTSKNSLTACPKTSQARVDWKGNPGALRGGKGRMGKHAHTSDAPHSPHPPRSPKGLLGQATTPAPEPVTYMWGCSRLGALPFQKTPGGVLLSSNPPYEVLTPNSLFGPSTVVSPH